MYIGFSVLVLPKRCPGRLSSVFWGAKRTVVFWAHRTAAVPPHPARPRPAARPCAAPPRPACGMTGFWIRQVALIAHELFCNRIINCENLFNSESSMAGFDIVGKKPTDHTMPHLSFVTAPVLLAQIGSGAWCLHKSAAEWCKEATGRL